MMVLVTGATGFIGRHVIDALLRRSTKVRIVSRQGTQDKFSVDNVEVVHLPGLGTTSSEWADAVANCGAVIHLAALAHIPLEKGNDPVQAFQMANVDFARACAEAAVGAGVKRFIFMSSVGVHGAASGKHPIQVASAIQPHTPYANSKAQAEQSLAAIVYGSSMELTVIRPPLVYGLGAPGNFGALVRAISFGLPLPMGMLTVNRRSFVGVDNLVDLIVACLSHPNAANQTFLVSDGEDLSTVALLRRLGQAMGKPARLFPVPVSWLALGARLLGKRAMFQSLSGSLQVDISKTRELLEWNPPVSVDEGLRRAVRRTL